MSDGERLSVRGLDVVYRTPAGTLLPVRDVGFSVRRGSVLGVVGESGSGKSTVAFAITRLLAANAEITRGSVVADGIDVLRLDESGLTAYRGGTVSMVFQDPMTSQNPVISYARIFEDIQRRDRTRSRRAKRDRAIEMLRTVGIPDPERRIDQFPHEFSGGMRQRAAIAMALILDPAILIADEPTTALDVTTEVSIVRLLRRLADETETAMVVVSHNLGLVAALCDEVAIMYAGEIVEFGTADQVFEAPRHPYTRKLFECDPARIVERAARLPTIPGRVPVVTEPPRACVFAPRCGVREEACERTAPALVDGGGGHLDRCLRSPLFASADRVVAFPGRGGPLHGRARGAAGGAALAVAARPSEVPAALPVSAPARVLAVQDLVVRFPVRGGAASLLPWRASPVVEAVAGVSLAIAGRETLAVVGESGSGKTTLGRAMIGLVKPSAGVLSIGDATITDFSDRAFRPIRRAVSMMFQDPVGSLSPRLRVGRLLAEPFEFAGEPVDTARLRQLCDMVGLPDSFLDRYPHELSGGQARRVGVARALALRPRLVIADEPTAGLDVSIQGDVLNLMADIKERTGTSFLLISHNLPAVRHVADRIVVFYLGRAVETGPAEVVFARPAHPYTEALVGGVLQPSRTRSRPPVELRGDVPSLLQRPPGCEFHTRCPFVEERCRRERPLPQDLGGGRTAACHFPRL